MNLFVRDALRCVLLALELLRCSPFFFLLGRGLFLKRCFFCASGECLTCSHAPPVVVCFCSTCLSCELNVSLSACTRFCHSRHLAHLARARTHTQMDVEARQFLFKSCFAWNVGLALDLTPSMSNHIDRSLATYRKYIDAITQVGQTGVAPPLPEYVEPSLDAALSSSSSSSASGAAGSGASGAESAPSPADLLALLLAAQQQRQYS